MAPQAHGTQLFSFFLFPFLRFLLIARADCSPRWGHMCVQKHSKVPLLYNMGFSGFLKETPVCKKKTHHKNIQKSRAKGQKLAQSLEAAFRFFFFFFASATFWVTYFALSVFFFFFFFFFPLFFFKTCKRGRRRLPEEQRDQWGARVGGCLYHLFFWLGTMLLPGQCPAPLGFFFFSSF